MKVIICGAGQVGQHAAEVLAAAGHQITVVDTEPRRVATIEDTMDVRTLVGNAANADVLREAGGAEADMVIAATFSDEINLLTASVGRGVGARKSIARVHHSAYFDERGLDYCRHFQIDQLICPEYTAALAIASTLRNPGALAIETFARGRVEIQEVRVSARATAVGKSLPELGLPRGMLLAAVTRSHEAFVPNASTVIEPGDTVVLVGNAEVFETGMRKFQAEDHGRMHVAIMGGPSMGVWLCRALHRRKFSIRLFETDRERAEELAEKLDWVTVLQADPTDVTVFEEEGLADVDAFVGLVADDDEHNILGCAWAKSMGVKTALTVVQSPTYLYLLRQIGIDHAFTPRILAAREIIGALAERPMESIASLAEGTINVYRVEVPKTAEVVGRPLRELRLLPQGMIAAIQHDGRTSVPTADDVIHPGDTVLLIGRQESENALRRRFTSR